MQRVAAQETTAASTLTGVLTAKGDRWIEVRADGESEAKRYIPHWRGGLPKDGGGPDATTLKQIRALRAPARVRLNWEFNEHRRINSIEVLEPLDREGVVLGEVIAKGETWIQVRPDNGAPAERYTPRWIGGLPGDGGGLDRDMLRTIAEFKAGDKVRLEWRYEERLRVVGLQRR